MMHGPINIGRQYYEQDGALEYTIESVTANNIKVVVMTNLRSSEAGRPAENN
jgi:hypothetical protein